MNLDLREIPAVYMNLEQHVEKNENMQKILKEIQSGKFAREWIKESEEGRANFNALREAGAKHPIEAVGKSLRAMMPWLSAGKQKVSDISGG